MTSRVVSGPSLEWGSMCCNGAVTTWLTDLTDLPPVEAQVSVARRARADFMVAVVQAATSRPEEDELWLSAVRCIGGARCRGRVHVCVAFDDGEVHWRCATCGDDGVVRGWVHDVYDLSEFVPFDELLPWGVDDTERDLLLEATRGLRDLRAVIMRASPHPQHPDVLVVYATSEELDDLYTLVEELADVVRGRRQRELLEGLRAGLSTAIDGF